MSSRCRLREAWINTDDLCSAFIYRILNPLEGNRVIGSRIASHDKKYITVFKIIPVIGHCAASERLCQSRYSWAVSDTGLMFYINKAQPP